MSASVAPTLDSFTTARLVAERLTPEHRDEIARMHRDARTMAMLGGVRDDEKTREYLERNLAHWDRYGYGLWILRDRKSGAMIGRGLLRHLDVQGQDDIETGYAFYPAWWGRGLATEIARRCVDLGFEVLHAPSIVGLTTPANTASLRVLRKVGMVPDRELDHGGVPHVLLRVTRETWSARQIPE
ncbi:MAG TPA: GNAT family N-acetyltransferase [Gemmatimonadales bacterium]|jgi:ribosomal-protein-alanine N-acetyltransferase|nr:GNAT family N-acetyltransferase [Gemmatimonadales bacterium]